MWLWEWEEGAAEAVSTFRVAAQFCREFDGFIFCHNEAILYKWVEEYEPALFAEIQKLVKEGKWFIMGGWHLQPDGNMPSGEGFIRNIMAGREYFDSKFGREARSTAVINLDTFGHSRGLVQICAKSGYKSYFFVRPGSLPLPSNTFKWIGYDGSEIIAVLAPGGYGSQNNKGFDKVEWLQNEAMGCEQYTKCCMWGVGNHGGGPSRHDLMAITERMKASVGTDVELVHSTPDAFVQYVIDSKAELPSHDKHINFTFPGCYTSQVRIKQRYKKLENWLFSAEKMCSQLAASSDFVYPVSELKEAMNDMVTIQFHDAIPGSSIQPVEEMSLRQLDHGLEILSRIRARAFFALCAGQKKAEEGEIPIMCYNPHPYPVEGDFQCEFNLQAQNHSIPWHMPEVYQNGVRIPAQLEHEYANIAIDWRKRVIFHATLAPMQITRFDCRMHIVEKRPTPCITATNTHYLFDNSRMHVEISRTTGLIDLCIVDGKKMLTDNSCVINVFQDTPDSWLWFDDRFDKKIGEFKLMSDSEGSDYSAQPEVIPSVRVIEDGDVRTVIESVFEYGRSGAYIRYYLSKQSNSIDLKIRIQNSDKKKMFKLAIPFVSENMNAVAEVAYGEEQITNEGKENPSQSYIRLSDSDVSMAFYKRGMYGVSITDSALQFSLMRSVGYSTHPIEGRPLVPTDRHNDWQEQGERDFELRIVFGECKTSDAVEAQKFNEEPMILSFFPSGSDAPKFAPMIVLDNEKIEMSALKIAENGNGFLVRLFNPMSESAECTVRSELFGIEEVMTFGKYEVKSFIVSNSGIEFCNMIEE